MAELSNPPPAPPPPPPTFLKSPKILESSKRSSTNSNRIVGVSTTQPSQRPPFAGVHPETLQHAAASLRKTQHREPLFSYESNTELGRSDNLSSKRHWSDFTEHAPLVSNSTGTAIHATPSDTKQPSAIDLQYKYTVPLKNPINKIETNSNKINNNVCSNSLNRFNKANIFAHDNSDFNKMEKSKVYVRHVPINISSPLNTSNYNNTKKSFLNENFENNYNTSSNFFKSQTQNKSEYKNFTDQPNHYVTENPLNNTLLNRQNYPFKNYSLDSTLPIIKDPKSYIKNYATTTPVSVLNEENDAQTNFSTVNNKTYDFAKELRNSGLTERQKVSNTFKESLLKERPVPNFLNSLYQNANKQTKNFKLDSVDALIQDMSEKLQTKAQDICAQCKTAIDGDIPGVTALGNSYHVSCFTCNECKKQLAGCSFYNVDGRHLCQVDYMNCLEKCDKCGTPITQKILRAMDKAFHPECFTCPACNKSLDGIPFTIDKQNHAYCLECYHERFSPRCAACLKVIAPIGNETEVARVIAMDQSYHIDCYKCEDCGMKLNSKVEGQGCYPIESHLLCKNCNLKRLKDNYQTNVE